MVLVRNSPSGEEIDTTIGVVTSVFGRSGNVVAVFNDYSASLVRNDSAVAGVTVANALNTLAGAITTIITTSNGLASAETITPIATATGTVTIDLPNIKIDTAARENTVIGVGTPALVSLNVQNTIYGDGAGASLLTTGADANLNTLVGLNSGSNITTGSANTCIAAPATTLTTGGSNVLVGPNADVPAAGTASYLNLKRGISC